MESFKLIPLLIIILLCIVLYLIIKKVKRGWLGLLIIFIIIIGGVKIHDRIINSVFYNFETELCRSYPEINNIELKIINGGSFCMIYVDLEKDTKDEYIENIFIDMLKKLNQEPMSGYLKGSTNCKNKSWVFLCIRFLGTERGRFDSEFYQHTDWFTKENQQVQTWKNSITGKIYKYSDYMQ